jgi:hypothetical protein
MWHAALSKKVFYAKEDKLKTINLAAVFALPILPTISEKISKDILEENEIEFQILKPLVEETIQKGHSS